MLNILHSRFVIEPLGKSDLKMELKYLIPLSLYGTKCLTVYEIFVQGFPIGKNGTTTLVCCNFHKFKDMSLNILPQNDEEMCMSNWYYKPHPPK